MQKTDEPTPVVAKKLRGFALMSPEVRRAIAKKGGHNVRNDRRSFSSTPGLASQAGKIGGKLVRPENRSFSVNRALAAEAGRKGGKASQQRRVKV